MNDELAPELFFSFQATQKKLLKMIDWIINTEINDGEIYHRERQNPSTTANAKAKFFMCSVSTRSREWQNINVNFFAQYCIKMF
jgi:hypothetical protein